MKKPIMDNLFLLEEQRQDEHKPKKKEKPNTESQDEDTIIYCYDREASNEQGHHEPRAH